jgi:hypothetical protein
MTGLFRVLEIICPTCGNIKNVNVDIANFLSEVHYTISILRYVDEIYDEDLIQKLFLVLNIKRISNYRLSFIKEFINQIFQEK